MSDSGDSSVNGSATPQRKQQERKKTGTIIEWSDTLTRPTMTQLGRLVSQITSVIILRRVVNHNFIIKSFNEAIACLSRIQAVEFGVWRERRRGEKNVKRIHLSGGE